MTELQLFEGEPVLSTEGLDGAGLQREVSFSPTVGVFGLGMGVATAVV